MFEEMAVLVDAQGEMLDAIEAEGNGSYRGIPKSNKNPQKTTQNHPKTIKKYFFGRNKTGLLRWSFCDENLCFSVVSGATAILVV